MLMSTDVASVMLPVSRGILERERDLDSGSAAVRGMKRGDPEPEGAAAAGDSVGAECKRARMDGTGELGQVSVKIAPLYCDYETMYRSDLILLVI